MESSHALASAKVVALRWISGPRYDLLWYLAPCLASYLLLWLNLGRRIETATLWWVWTLGFDGPHVFGTLNRTYLDREEWRTRGGLLLRALIWFLPGPIIVLASAAVGAKLPYYAFLLFATLWAYWHVVRQHYGFLVMYQKKNGEPAGLQNRVDYWVFYVLMIVPFVSLFPRNEHGRKELVEYFGFPATPGLWENRIQAALYTLIFAALALYVIKEIARFASGQALNAPKNLLMLSCVGLHLVICLHPQIGPKLDPLMFTVLVTLYHNIQYTGIVWFYNRNRYHREDAVSRYGAAARVAKRFLVFYALGLLFTIVLRYTHWTFSGNAVGLFMPGPNAISETPIGSQFTVTELAIAFWWGFAFNHYWLDQKIWRVSKDQRLVKDLKIS